MARESTHGRSLNTRGVLIRAITKALVGYSEMFDIERIVEISIFFLRIFQDCGNILMFWIFFLHFSWNSLLGNKPEMFYVPTKAVF